MRTTEEIKTPDQVRQSQAVLPHWLKLMVMKAELSKLLIKCQMIHTMAGKFVLCAELIEENAMAGE